MKVNYTRLIFAVVALIVIFAIGMANPAAAATAVEVPGQINDFISILAVAAVTAGFNYLFLWVGLDLRNFATPVSGALALYLVAELQNYINLLSDTFPQYDGAIIFTLNVIVLLIGSIGTLYVLAMHRNSVQKTLAVGEALPLL